MDRQSIKYKCSATCAKTAYGPAAAVEFSQAAIRMLERRAANAPPERGEQRWMPGWRNRCLTYAQGL